MRCDGRDNTKKTIVIPQKSCLFLFFGGRGRADVNQQKHTKKDSKFKFDKKSC